MRFGLFARALSFASCALSVGCGAEVTPLTGEYHGTLQVTVSSTLGLPSGARRPANVRVDAAANGYVLEFGEACRVTVEARSEAELVIAPQQTCQLSDHLLVGRTLTLDEGWRPSRVQIQGGRLDFFAAFATENQDVGVLLEYHGMP